MARQQGVLDMALWLNLVPFALVLLISTWYVYGEVNRSSIYTVWSHSYASTMIEPYDWSYLRVELPPKFASWTFALDTDARTEAKSLPKSHIYTVPMMCFRQGGPPLPDVSGTSLKGLVVEQVYNQSITQSLNIQECYALRRNMTFILTNEEVAEGGLYIGLFNGIGPARTQSKMINRGKPYTFRAIASVDSCNGTKSWGQYCDKKLHQLPCEGAHNDDDDGEPKDATIQGRRVTCTGSSHPCYGDLSPDLFFLELEDLSEELVLTSKNVTLDDKATRLNDKRRGQVSLVCYARIGAIPTTKLFDYSSDISKTPLVIKLPKLGTWYFYIVPAVRKHGFPRESWMHPMPQLCHSLHWEVIRCASGKAGPNCSWERYTIEANEERAFINVNGSRLPSTDFPLASTLSKPMQGHTLNSAWSWIYFHVEIPRNSATRNIRIKLTSNTTIAHELYARLGGVPSTDAWDYYYVNQTSNSNNGSLFKLYESSYRNVEFDLVYASEGNWTIGLRNQLSMLVSGSETFFSLSLESCPRQCSGHGTCEDATDSKTCSFCRCDIFHGGIDCSLELVSKTEWKVQVASLVASNAAAILPAMWALSQKSYAEWVVFLSSGASSAIYHACDAEWMCLLKYHTLQFLDFWLSFVAVISTFVYMAFVKEAVKRGILSIAWIVTALMAIGDATSPRNITLLIVIGAVCLATALLVDISAKFKSLPGIFHLAKPSKISPWCIKLVKNLHRQYRWTFVILGFISLALAATSWNLEDSQNYWLWHSIWHIAIYSTAFFFLVSKVNSRNDCTPNVNHNDDLQVLPTESPHDDINP